MSSGRSRKHGDEVELITRAVTWCELSNGLIRFGIPRGWIKDLFAAMSAQGHLTGQIRQDGAAHASASRAR